MKFLGFPIYVKAIYIKTNLEVTTSLPLNKANDQTKVNENCYIELTHLLQVLFSWPAQYYHLILGKLVSGKNLMIRAQVRSKHEHNHREIHVAEKRKRAPIILLNKTKSTQFCLSGKKCHRRILIPRKLETDKVYISKNKK